MPRSHSGYCTGLLIRALRGSQVQFLPEAFILFTKMQTFLPYPDFERSLKTLDSRRLGKQRVEAFQILNLLLKRTSKNGWKNHPAVKMWKGHTNALKIYFNKSIEIWISRGYKNNMNKEVLRGKVVPPKWIGNKKFHSAHRSNLLRKNKEYYSKFKWKESTDIPYFWPV